MKSVIFFDIDGTIASEDGKFTIPDSTRLAVRLAREKGNLAFINTGRTAFNVNRKIRETGFDGIICGCGTYIEYMGDVLFYNRLSPDLCRETAELMRRCRVTPVYEHRDGYFFDDEAAESPELTHFLESFVEDWIDISRRVSDDDFTFDKFVVWENEFSDMELFRRETGKNFGIIDRGNGFYENVPLGFTKATAIDFILEYLGIPLENAYAIGDSMNDLPMLKAVPNSIAMGGAETIYPYVSYITTPLHEDGIYNALAHFNLI